MFHLIDEERAGRSIIGDVIRLVRADSLAIVIASARALFDWSLASDGLRQDVSRIRLEGRAEVLRKLLGEACGKSNQLALAQVEAIRNADVNQLERWVGRLVAGETLERVLEEVGP